MELREGYKQTEVGLIPEDWSVDQIKNHCDIKTGGKNTQDRVKDGTYPFFVRSQTVERINSYTFDGEAVLTAGDGVGTGKVFHYINGKFDCHQRVYRMSNFSDKLDGYYFYLYFSNNFYGRISQMTAKSSVDSVRMEMIADMNIPLPPTKTEQSAIATALSDIDALITQLEKLITKKRQIKQGAMQTLLNPFESNGKLKDGWKEKQLSDVAEIRDGTHQTPTYTDSGVPFYSVENVTRDDFINTKFISEDEHKVLTKTLKMKKGDVLMTRIGSIGDCKLIDWNVNASFYVSLALLRFKPVVSSLFFTHFSKTSYFQREIENNSLQFAIPKKINLSQIEDVLIAFPKDTNEQDKLGELISDLDKEIDALQDKLSKLLKVKQGMMQSLLTGQIRLVEPTPKNEQ